MPRRIILAPPDPAWPEQFRAEAARLRTILGDEAVAIEHIGSTAIPGIPAKPTIDVLVAARDLAAIDALRPTLEAAGYAWRGENGIPGRRYLVCGTEEAHTHHVHILCAGNPEIARHLAFRDYLVAHPAEAQAYARLKEQLAARLADDPAAYTEAKSAFIREVDARAAAWRRSSA